MLRCEQRVPSSAGLQRSSPRRLMLEFQPCSESKMLPGRQMFMAPTWHPSNRRWRRQALNSPTATPRASECEVKGRSSKVGLRKTMRVCVPDRRKARTDSPLGFDPLSRTQAPFSASLSFLQTRGGTRTERNQVSDHLFWLGTRQTVSSEAEDVRPKNPISTRGRGNSLPGIKRRRAGSECN